MNQTNNHKTYFETNNNFYANIGVNAGFSRSKNETDSHIESAVVSTITGKDANSTITYNNVKNITYQGTQAKDTNAVYNNVETITKEAVELNNRYSSSGSNFGINAGATIGYGHKMQTTGNGGSVSLGRSSQNTVETVYHNGSFVNVNEVHNNTGTMTVSGFNQEGGKVTGNINNLIVESRQNTSTTTGRSSGMNIGLGVQRIPNSVGINGSRTEGSRAYVDNQTTFIVGEGSNLTVGKANNTGAIISTTGNGTIDIQSYTGKDIQNYDTVKTKGGSVGFTTGNVPLSNIGFNQETRDKEGITRNTVTGNVNVHNATGDAINRDISRANETTKDTHSRTNINVESQTIDYALNPQKFKEDLEVAVLEGKATGETILKTIENIVNGGKDDIGEPERRAFNEIKESIVRVKTAPEMDLIAKEDLTSKAVLDRLKIDGIEKFNPDDPNLPKAVRERLDELAENGLTIGAFYDKTTNKIFINEDMENEDEIRASVAREWKISEDLKNDRGKSNSSGQLKSTVAGEVAYDDILKRGREGNTEGIDLDGLNYAEMSEGSEVTSDSSDVYVQRWDEEYAKWIEETKKILKPLKSSNLSMEQKRKILAQYDERVSPNQMLAGLKKVKLASPYEGIYILSRREPEYLVGIIKNNSLYLADFDPAAWNRVKNRQEYKIMQNKLIQNGEVLVKEYLKSHPYLEESNQIKNVERKIINPTSKNARKRDERLQTSEKFVGSEETDIEKRQEKNKGIPDFINSMEFALGTPSMIGSLIFNKVKNNDGSINLTVRLKYNLTDEFGKVYGEFGPEYGKPYDMLGETKYHTYKKIKSHFKNEAEYLKYIRDLK